MSHCGRIYFTVNESTLNFCNLLFSSFKKWHFKLEINRGNSLNFNYNTMSVQNEHIARQARFLIKSLTTEIMWPSYKSRSIFCPLFWWPETRLIRREIRYLFEDAYFLLSKVKLNLERNFYSYSLMFSNFLNDYWNAANQFFYSK